MMSIVNNMDYRQQQRAEEWKNSVQALEMERERIEQEIIKIQEQIDSHNLLIWDIRDRVHLDLGWEIENAK